MRIPRLLLSSSISYFFPPLCVLCKSLELDSKFALCESCQSKLEEVSGPICPRCGDPNSTNQLKAHSCQDCLKAKLPFEICRSIFSLKKPFSDLLYLFKFKNSELCLDFFTQKLADKIPGFLQSADYLLPVPSHWFTLIRRGYNPSLILAKALSRKIKVPVEFSALKRVKLGSAQKTLNRQQRLKNIRNVFRLAKKHPFKNKKVLLIDDVYTTGATLIECAKLLKNAGAEVYGLTLARTPLEFS
ncbi:MAG: ComF family protein [Deltaproteobacteria bacterium]|nr:ComF family protein [Deltaproteobacteria bacterium]